MIASTCSAPSMKAMASTSIPSRATVVCKAAPNKMIERMQQAALIGTASALLSLSASAPAFARAAPNTSYQEELMASVKARGGAGLPSLTSSPAVEAPAKAEKKAAPVAVPAKTVAAPTPRPSINGKELPTDAPTIKLPEAAVPKAQTEAISSFASYTTASTPKAAAAPKSEESGNNNAVVLGGVVLVAVAGIALAGGNNGDGAVAAAPAAVAAPAASDADDEVKKVQAWIAAYKKRSGMA